MKHNATERDIERAGRWLEEAAARRAGYELPEFDAPTSPTTPTPTSARLADRSYWILSPAARIGGPASNRFVHLSRGDGSAAADRLIDEYARGRSADGSRAVGIIEPDPFGVSMDLAYRFDALVECLLSGHTHLFERFQENSRRIIDAGLRHVIHLGSLVEGRTRLSDEVVEMVLDYTVYAVPGLELSIDSAVLRQAGSPTHELATRLRGESVTVWIESLALDDPARRDGHWAGFNQWCLDIDLRRHLARGTRLMGLDEMGETVVAYTAHESGSTHAGDAHLSSLLEREPRFGRAWQPWDHAEFSGLLGEALS